MIKDRHKSSAAAPPESPIANKANSNGGNKKAAIGPLKDTKKTDNAVKDP